MAGRFDFILDFLTTDHFAKVKADALKEILPSVGQINYYDEKRGIIQGYDGGDDGEIHEYEWSFDGYMVNIIITEIQPRLKEMVRDLKYESINGKLHSDTETYQILDRLVIDIENRYVFLSKATLYINETRKLIRILINDLKAYKTKLRRDKIWKPKAYKEIIFKGYKLTHSRITNPVDLITKIWHKLLSKNLVENRDKEAFLSLFENRWTMNTIKWLGSPKDFYVFYDALFNPLIKGEELLIENTGTKGRLPTILNCFDVRDPQSKHRIDNKGIKKYNSKPKENPLNKALRSLIDDHFH